VDSKTEGKEERLHTKGDSGRITGPEVSETWLRIQESKGKKRGRLTMFRTKRIGHRSATRNEACHYPAMLRIERKEKISPRCSASGIVHYMGGRRGLASGSEARVLRHIVFKGNYDTRGGGGGVSGKLRLDEWNAGVLSHDEGKAT